MPVRYAADKRFRSPTAVPTEPVVRPADVYTSCVLGPGGAGSVKLFTTPVGQAVPRLESARYQPPRETVTSYLSMSPAPSRRARFFRWLFGIEDLHINTHVNIDRPADRWGELFFTQSDFTTNMMKAGLLSYGVEMRVGSLQFDLIGGSLCDIERVLSQVTYDLRIGAKSRAAGTLLNTPKLFAPLVVINRDDDLCMEINAGSVPLPIQAPILLRAVLRGWVRDELQ